MKILVCVKRVPLTGGKMVLTADERAIETRHLGFTVSPHEECGVEEAVRIVEAQGGEVAVVTLGPPEAEEQLREMLALGADRAILLETDGSDWDPEATAAALTPGHRGRGAGPGDLRQRVGRLRRLPGRHPHRPRARAPDRHRPEGARRRGRAAARPAGGDGGDVYRVPLPAVVTVKEGINLPRYPSVPAKLRARRKPVDQVQPTAREPRLELVRLRVPEGRGHQAEVLGEGPSAAPAVVELLQRLGVA